MPFTHSYTRYNTVSPLARPRLRVDEDEDEDDRKPVELEPSRVRPPQTRNGRTGGQGLEGYEVNWDLPEDTGEAMDLAGTRGGEHPTGQGRAQLVPVEATPFNPLARSQQFKGQLRA